MPTKEELHRAQCWEQVDRVAKRDDLTSYKRGLRYHQAKWRARHEIPEGHQAKRDGSLRPLGSRIELEAAKASKANFVTAKVRAAVDRRVASPEKHQTLNTDRLWSDLLSSMPMCFNLFGELDGADGSADRAVHQWWPDAPGQVEQVRFEWSPGRRDPLYLGNRSAFDVAFELAFPDGGRGVVGVETKYHEHAKAEDVPSEERLRRYREVSDLSKAFKDGAVDQIIGTDLQQIWLDHLLALAMLQHPAGEWQWVRFVLVYPAANVSFAEASTRYRELLHDGRTFATVTVEELLGAEGALGRELVDIFRERYLP